MNILYHPIYNKGGIPFPPQLAGYPGRPIFIRNGPVGVPCPGIIPKRLVPCPVVPYSAIPNRIPIVYTFRSDSEKTAKFTTSFKGVTKTFYATKKSSKKSSISASDAKAHADKAAYLKAHTAAKNKSIRWKNKMKREFNEKLKKKKKK